MKYVIYCDESRHDCAPGHRFMAIGGLWVPREGKAELTRDLRRQRRSLALNGEVKWSKVSDKRLDAYRAEVDFFFAQDLRFRAIVVEQEKVDVARFHGGDQELGFYKFYYEMLVKWLWPGNEYLILLDFKTNRGADRYTTLKRFLERQVKGTAWITDLTIVDSAESPLAQLSDLLTGAVAASWCGIRPGSAKEQLATHIAAKDGRRSLTVEDPTPADSKVNIFRIDLS